MQVPFLDLRRSHAELRDEILPALARTYDTQQFCLGRDVEEFESAFAGLCGFPRTVGVSNGTAALHLAALALGLGPGDEIIVPAFTFIATAWTASHTGALPVFADIRKDDYLLDPEDTARKITPRTKAIVLVHLFGQPANPAPFLEMARQHGLFLIEDCAQAHLASSGGVPVGMSGDVGTFSFYPTKNLGGCGEGGAVVSRHAELLERVATLRVHGSRIRYQHDLIGYNYRMEGFQAAALSVKLRHLEKWTVRRREIAKRYQEELCLEGLQLPKPPSSPGTSVYHQFTIRHPARDTLREHLRSLQVGTDIIYPGILPEQPCYQSLLSPGQDWPAAREVSRTCLSLPIFPELTDEEVEYVINSVNCFRGS